MKTISSLLTPFSVLALAAVLAYGHFDRPSPPLTPDQSVNAVAMGKLYAPKLAVTYAAGWDAAALALEQGKPVVEANKALQAAWLAERLKAFAADVQPGFNLVLPEGAEPSDPTKRSQVVSLWRDFARGLRGGK